MLPLAVLQLDVTAGKLSAETASIFAAQMSMTSIHTHVNQNDLSLNLVLDVYIFTQT